MKLGTMKGCTAQGQMEQKAKLDSTSEITSQYDTVQLHPRGSCRAERRSTTILNVCTCNVRTLQTEDDLCRLIEEF